MMLGRVRVRILFEPRDLWFGVYWTRATYSRLLVYVCLLPCLPIRLEFFLGRTKPEGA
jgi:hypothetical protein